MVRIDRPDDDDHAARSLGHRARRVHRRPLRCDELTLDLIGEGRVIELEDRHGRRATSEHDRDRRAVRRRSPRRRRTGPSRRSRPSRTRSRVASTSAGSACPTSTTRRPLRSGSAIAPHRIAQLGERFAPSRSSAGRPTSTAPGRSPAVRGNGARPPGASPKLRRASADQIRRSWIRSGPVATSWATAARGPATSVMTFAASQRGGFASSTATSSPVSVISAAHDRVAVALQAPSEAHPSTRSAIGFRVDT